ncbi:MAG TPA: efflux RND transporter periplasmic adaptor subunit, partial [Pseudogracilibacillus sp.]|nr:efflux RND transporter periplasmic adaptor subunit [Pseudogracilibacillus sp.]
MRLTRKHIIIIAVTSVFILVNILLIYFDTEQKVSKTSHVKEWTSVGQKDMYESIDTKGVLDFSEESFVYFDDNLGEFQSFFVEEGQQVNVGEDLYSYEVRNYFEAASQLEGEIEKLSNQMAAIEAAITKMDSFQIPSSGASMPPQTS